MALKTRKTPTDKDIKTAAKLARFLDYVANGMPTVRALEAVKMTKNTLAVWKRDVPKFELDYLNAKALGVYSLEAEAQRRAVDGVQRPVFYKGEICGYTTEYSDNMLLALLASRAPERWCRTVRAAQWQFEAEKRAREDDGATFGDDLKAALDAIEAAKIKAYEEGRRDALEERGLTDE